LLSSVLEQAVLGRSAPGSAAVPDLPDLIRALPDRAFLEVLVASVGGREVGGVTYPGFPEDVVQSNFVGSSGETALREAFNFWQLLKEYGALLDRPLARGTRMLDFGCGWGRYLRFLCKDVDVANLHGVDVDPGIVQRCRELGLPGQLKPIQPLGTLPYADASIDCVMAYSVFTHLPEHVNLHWKNEIARVVRPGGVFAFTLEPRRFLEFVRDKTPGSESPWHKVMARFAPQMDTMLERFDEGRFCYLPSGGGEFRPSETYGDAAVPLPWLEEQWAPQWEVREYVDDADRFWQAVAVVQRR
jgi:SAM-dependent methyltransferase